jgi:hypothetical protein
MSTTTKYYTAAGDGACYGTTGTVWATQRNAASAASVGTTDASTMAALLGTTYYIRRSQWPFDTRLLSSAVTVTKATFSVKTNASVSGGVMHIITSTQADPTSLAVGDYSKMGSSSLGNFTPVNLDEWYYTDLSDLSAVTKGNYTKLALKEAHDLNNSAPATNENFNDNFYTSEASGTANDPYLEVVYNIPAAAGILTMF